MEGSRGKQGPINRREETGRDGRGNLRVKILLIMRHMTCQVHNYSHTKYKTKCPEKYLRRLAGITSMRDATHPHNMGNAYFRTP